MEYISRYRDYESECERKTYSRFPSEIKLFEEMFDLFLEINHNITTYSIDQPYTLNETESAFIIINTKLIESLNACFGLLLKGHYIECEAVARNIFESLNLLEYFINNPQDAKKWNRGKKFPQTKVFDKIDCSDKMKKFYDLLCDSTHPNLLGVIDKVLVERENPGTVELLLYSRFNEIRAYQIIMISITFCDRSIHLNDLQFSKYKIFDNDNKKEKLGCRFIKTFNSFLKFFDKQ